MKLYLSISIILLNFYAFCQQDNENNLIQALLVYQKTENVRFSYDPELIGMVKSELASDELPLEVFISKLNNSDLPITIQKIDSTYYTVGSRLTSYQLNLQDAEDSTAIPPEQVNILVNGRLQPLHRKDNHLVFAYKPSLNDSLTIHVLGYNPTPLTVDPFLKQKQLLVYINPTVIELKGLVVTDYLTHGIMINPKDQSIKIATNNLPLLPGETDGDLFASLVSLPGITTPDNRPGNLYIRGSSTDQSLILYDDIPIYHRGHYYGTISPYNPKVVENVTVSRNGYHPRMGGRVGGAVEIKTDNHWNDDYSFGIGLNTIYAMGYAKAATSHGGVMISGRRSYPISFNSPKLNSISDMVFAASNATDPEGNYSDDFSVLFEDYNIKFNHAINKHNNLSISGIYVKTSVGYTQFVNSIKEQSGFQNLGLNIKWKSELNNGWESALSGMMSSYNYKYLTGPETPNYGLNVPGYFSVNTIQDIGITEEFTKTTSLKNQWQLGMNYKFQNVFFESKSPLRNDSSFYNSQNLEAHTISPYVNFEWNNHPKFYVQAGLRSNYYSLMNDLRLEPRISISYDLSNKLILKGSAGYYNQYLSQVKNLEFTFGGYDNELWLLANDKSANIISGNQLMTGVIWQGNSWILDVEGYFKTADNITQYSTRRFKPMGEWLARDLTIHGIDFLLKKQLNEQASVWAGYSLNEMKIHLDTAESIIYDDKYSQPNVFNLGFSYEWSHFKLSAGWKYATGLYAHSLDIIEVEKAYKSGRFRQPALSGDDPFADIPDRYPNVHFLDLSASYKIPKSEKWPFDLTAGLSVINLYNQSNLTDRVIRLVRNEPVFLEREAMRFAPNLMVILEY